MYKVGLAALSPIETSVLHVCPQIKTSVFLICRIERLRERIEERVAGAYFRLCGGICEIHHLSRFLFTVPQQKEIKHNGGYKTRRYAEVVLTTLPQLLRVLLQVWLQQLF
ncbi:MAG: hypothetical protein ACYCTY_08030 [Sulfuricella sp.]